MLRIEARVARFDIEQRDGAQPPPARCSTWTTRNAAYAKTCDTMALRASGLLASFTSMIVGRPDDSTARISA